MAVNGLLSRVYYPCVIKLRSDRKCTLIEPFDHCVQIKDFWYAYYLFLVYAIPKCCLIRMNILAFEVQ